MTEIPAAWFPDPAGTPAMRWWDGMAWTEHLAMPQPQAPVATTPYTPEPASYAATAYTPAAYGSSLYVPGSRTRFDNMANYSTPSLTYTAAVWWVALTPVWFSIVQIIASAIGRVGGLGGAIFGLVLDAGAFVLAGAFAVFDQRQLQRAGYVKPASAWWWLLTPLGYLIARGIYMYRQKGRGWAPAIVLGSIFGAEIIFVALSAIYLVNARS